MFRFIHTYTAESFPGLARQGLWRDGDGLKLMHKPGFGPPFDFNTAVLAGTPLEKLLAELRCPFYVDRLQGGLGLTRKYPYDASLLRRCRTLLGDRFWGFQMHEWASNFRSDLERIEELAGREGSDLRRTDERTRFWQAVQSGALPLFLEARTAGEYASMRLPEDRTAFLRDAEALYAQRARETEGLLFPADSYFMAPRTALANGAKRLMPEVGWQIPGMRVQVAYTRGMAKAAGVPWGVYYECWQMTDGKALTIPFSLREGQDEWRENLLETAYGSALPFERREHGGSSLSLMERAWRYAYFSGADAVGEEYGVCNTFRELRDFSLSPYGEAKRRFLRFTEAFPELGTPYTPFAAVLPKELPMLDLYMDGRYLHYPAQAPDCPPTVDRPERFHADLQTLFGADGRFGNMGHVLRTGGLPGVVDLIHANMEQALDGYEYLIDLTGDASFRRRRNVVTAEEADRLMDGLLPCRFDNRLFASYNRTKDGWYVLVMNNDGVRHDGFQPDEFLPEADVAAPVRLSPATVGVQKTAGSGALHEEGDRLFTALKAGEWMLLRL